MNTLTIRLLLLVPLIIQCSFAPKDDSSLEYSKLQKLEQHALRKNVVREYIYDMTGIKGCNKTKIRYLGVARTDKGKEFKVLTSFFVYSTSADMCHGSSSVKIYNMKNEFVGQYIVGIPDDLPDILKNNTLVYLQNSKNCDLRKTTSIGLSNGLPKTFFIPCSKNGGDFYSFISGD